MRKDVLIIIFIILALVVIFGVIFKDNSPSGSSEIDIQLERQSFVIAVLNPDVLLKEKSGGPLRPIINETETKEGSTVITSTDGKAAILFPNNTITNIGPDTTLFLEQVGDNGNRSRMQLAAGSVWAKVESITGLGNYSIESNNMVASVRGTVFVLVVTDDTSELFVLEGVVRVQAKDPKTGRRLSEQIIEVRSGEKVLIDNNNPPSPDRPIKAQSIEKEDLNRQIIKANLTDEYRSRDEIKNLLKELVPIQIKQAPLQLPKKEPLTPEAIQSLTPADNVPEKVNLVITSVQPSIIEFNAQDSINGRTSSLKSDTGENISSTQQLPPAEEKEIIIKGSNFIGVRSVRVGETEISFIIKDGETIFAITSSRLEPSVYDVSVVNTKGESAVSVGALEISFSGIIPQ